jgi:hypothetical protein
MQFTTRLLIIEVAFFNVLTHESNSNILFLLIVSFKFTLSFLLLIISIRIFKFLGFIVCPKVIGCDPID